jgi:gas vesicle protein
MQAIARLALELICNWRINSQGGKGMNQRDGFTGGFIAGTVVGGVVGGVIGALLASRTLNELPPESKRKAGVLDANNPPKAKRRQMKATSSEQTIEVARRSLEDKIAQLNETIDEVRMSLGNVNGNQSPSNVETALGEELR